MYLLIRHWWCLNFNSTKQLSICGSLHYTINLIVKTRGSEATCLALSSSVQVVCVAAMLLQIVTHRHLVTRSNIFRPFLPMVTLCPVDTSLRLHMVSNIQVAHLVEPRPRHIFKKFLFPSAVGATTRKDIHCFLFNKLCFVKCVLYLVSVKQSWEFLSIWMKNFKYLAILPISHFGKNSTHLLILRLSHFASNRHRRKLSDFTLKLLIPSIVIWKHFSFHLLLFC